MKGLLYKEFCQNKLNILLSMLIPSLFFLIPAFIPMDDSSDYSVVNSFTEYANSGILIKILFLMIGLMMLDMMTFSFLSGDEIKKWAYFSASTPKGVKGQVFTKYAGIFMTSGIAVILLTITSALLNFAIKKITGEEITDVYRIIAYFFYIEIFLKSIDLPFCIRFGVKRGSAVKLSVIMGAFVIIMIYFLFGPISLNSDSFFDGLFEFIENLVSGGYSKKIGTVKKIIPFAVIGSYLISFIISCRLYMKGVESYDK